MDDFSGSIVDFVKSLKKTLDQYNLRDSGWWMIWESEHVIRVIGVSLVSQSQHIGSLLEPL